MAGNIRRIIDASAVLSRLMPDESGEGMSDDEFENQANRVVMLVAPQILPFEVANALKSAIKSDRLDVDLALNIYKNFIDLEIEYREVDLKKVIVLASKNKLSVYDAAYLQLAIENKCKLLTLNKQLKQVSDKIGL